MRNERFWLLGTLFALSGFTSLVYESLWIRSFSIAFGSTTLSMSLVIAIFFFGLAAGSLLGAQWNSRILRPRLVYAGLEAFIGVYCFFLYYTFSELPAVLSFFATLNTSPPTVLILKFFSTLILITPPTVAMGMTFPLMVRLLSPADRSVAQNVSRVYAINTLGALCGAFLSGFALIPWFGLWGTHSLMVILNLNIFLVLVRRPTESPIQKKNLIPPGNVDKSADLFRTLVLFSSAVVGFVAVGAEIVWNKYITLFLGTNIYGVSLTLSIFLFGIFLGSFLLSRLKTKHRSSRLYIGLYALSLITTLLSSHLLDQAPLLAYQWKDFFHSGLLSSKTLVVTLILLPPTALFGALLPLTIHLLCANNTDSPKFSGRVYSINTLGGILGSLTVGLFLIPRFGSATSLFYLGCLQLGTLFFLVLSLVKENKLFLIGPFWLAATGLTLLLLPLVQLQTIVQSAEYSYTHPKATADSFASYIDQSDFDMRYWAEGENSVVSLHYDINDKGEFETQRLILKSNGLSESFFNLSEPGQVPKYEGLLAVVPYLYHPEPKTAFVVGYGGGYTVEVLSSLGLDKIRVAEIEQKIVEASDYVYLGGSSILQRGNIDLKIQDARFLLSLSNQDPYDIIVSQPSHSWMSGVANLFTQDFFQIVKGRLSKKGLFSQWLNLYNMDPLTLQSIIRTFFEVFPHGAIFTNSADDQLILLGGISPLSLQYQKLKKMTADIYWQERLSFIPFNSDLALLSYFAMDRQQALVLSEKAPLNTDNNAFAEVRQSQLYYQMDSSSWTFRKFLFDHFSPSIGETEKLLQQEIQKANKGL